LTNSPTQDPEANEAPSDSGPAFSGEGCSDHHHT
jgi:hypothetical protein